MIENKHLLPNHNERLKELTLARHKNTSPLYATVPKAEYDALKKKLDICQKECIRIAELYKRDRKLFEAKMERMVKRIEETMNAYINPKILPTVMMVLQFLAAIPYAIKGDAKMTVYWIAAGVLTLALTYL